MPHPAIQDARRTVEAALARGDADAALAAVKAIPRDAPLEDGNGFRRLVAALPESVWQHDAAVASAMGASFRAADSPRGPAALGYFEAAEAALTREGDDAAPDRVRVWLGHAAALRSLGRAEEAQRYVERTRELDGPGILSVPVRVELRARSALEAGMIDLQSGRLDEARDRLVFALGLAEDHLARAEHVEALGGLALVEYFAAELAEAEGHLDDARRLAADAGPLDGPFGAPALTAEALIAIERHDIEAGLAVEPLLGQAAAGSDWAPLAHVVVGYLRLIERRLPEALDELQRARQDFHGGGAGRFGRDAGELLRASILVALDRGDEAWEVLREATPYPHHPLCPQRVTAQLRFRNGDLGGAVEALRECEALGDDHSMRTLMDVRMLRGAIEFERGEFTVSDGYVDRAVATMVRTGSRAPLRAIPAGTLAALATRALQRWQTPEARALLEHIAETTAGEHRLIEPLSSRELLVLAEVEKGSTVAGIAAALFISPNTVKTHLRRLYRKLGVTTRTDAIRKARALGLGRAITRDSPE